MSFHITVQALSGEAITVKQLKKILEQANDHDHLLLPHGVYITKIHYDSDEGSLYFVTG